uniref:Histone deacetylase n=1 Tax=Dastarcus helophoroides TaxID=1169899 RepID=A0A023W0M4_9CUCU|nr:histone deacetylase [Dastarcus helophoroides]
MADTAGQQAAAAETPVKKEKKVSKHPRSKPSHPPTSEMVNNAIKGLKERGGSSLQAIKKYVAANYKVDAEKVAPFIKKYLKSAVVSGSLVQTKGKGASGSFKLATSAVSGKPVASGEKKEEIGIGIEGKKKSASSKPKTKSPKKTGIKPKKIGSKKTAAADASSGGSAAASSVNTTTAAAKAKKSAEKKSIKAAGRPKSPSKAKKSNKSPTKKPKAPKPKTAKSVKAKKAASPKRKK